MTRPVSDNFKQKFFGEQVDDVYLTLVEVSHPDLPATIRLTPNGEDVVSGGETYVHFPLQVALGPDADEAAPRTSIRFANIDLRLTDGLRSIASPPTVTLSGVLASDPDTIEVGPIPFTLRDARYDDVVVEGTLAFEAIYQSMVPRRLMTPTTTPGLFGSRPPGAEWPPIPVRGVEEPPPSEPPHGWPAHSPFGRRPRS
jgi:hypothetical protein